jgi:hypothetical protein
MVRDLLKKESKNIETESKLETMSTQNSRHEVI